jgi:hypothetical protein
VSGFIQEADRNQGVRLPKRIDQYVSDEHPPAAAQCLPRISIRVHAPGIIAH